MMLLGQEAPINDHGMVAPTDEAQVEAKDQQQTSLHATLRQLEVNLRQLQSLEQTSLHATLRQLEQTSLYATSLAQPQALPGGTPRVQGALPMSQAPSPPTSWGALPWPRGQPPCPWTQWAPPKDENLTINLSVELTNNHTHTLSNLKFELYRRKKDSVYMLCVSIRVLKVSL